MMVTYHQATSLQQAMQLLNSQPTLKVLAGATDVYPAKATRAGWGQMSHPDVLDIAGLSELRGIEDRGDHWWIGALTTWSEIVRAEQLPPLFNGLKAAAREIGGIQIQNRGTLAGNIVTASPAGDSIPCLLALDAEIECVGGAVFRVPLDRFITGYRKTILDGELVTGVRVPKAQGHGHFIKLGARRYLVISIAMVAATFACNATGVVETARIAVGACTPVAVRVPALEARMIGQRLGHVLPTADDLAHLAPLDDVRASADYRRAAALQLVRDVIAAAARDWGIA
jgi:CO/xanthine dehydrogenase FAD-binding subunit